MENTNNITDIELVKNVQETLCQDSLAELIKRHSGLCVNVLKKYAAVMKFSSNGANFSFSDFLDDKDYIIWEAVRRFKIDKNAKFSTWVGVWTRFYCLNYISDNIAYVKNEVAEETQTTTDNTVHFNDTINLIETALDSIDDKRVKKVFHLRYFNPTKKKTTLKDIAKELNLSIERVRQFHTTGKKAIRRKINQDLA